MIDAAGATYKIRGTRFAHLTFRHSTRSSKMKTENKPGRPSDDVWSAPESGTVRDPTSGNQPSQGQDSGDSNPQSPKKAQPRKKTTAVGNQRKDSPAATG